MGSRAESGRGGGLSRFAECANGAETLGFSSPAPAQPGARHCARETDCVSCVPEDDPLGSPMTIRDVAELFGCSAWTIRQQYLPKGLPCFRLSPRGKLVFFHNQIVRWVIDRQRQKGGMHP